MGANNKLNNYITIHSVNMEKVKLDALRKIMREYEKLRKDLSAEIARFDLTEISSLSLKRKRMLRLFSQAGEVINTGYREIEKRANAELLQVASLEADFSRLAVNKAVGVNIASTALSSPMLEQVVSNTLIQGAKSAEWWKRQNVSTLNKFKDTIRMHLLRGSTLGQMVRSVRGTRENRFTDGILHASTKEAETLIRTSIQTVANRAAEATYRANSDIIRGYIWLSTLDSRTTEICAVRDGLEYTLDYQPIGHNIPWLEGPGSIHWNCRSRSMPLLKDYKNIPKGKQQQIRKLGFRATKFGPVARGTKFEPWLKAIDKERPGVAVKILGKKKAKLWRNSKLSLRDMVTGDGKPMSTMQLKRKYSKEWKKAMHE